MRRFVITYLLILVSIAVKAGEIGVDTLWFDDPLMLDLKFEEYKRIGHSWFDRGNYAKSYYYLTKAYERSQIDPVVNSLLPLSAEYLNRKSVVPSVYKKYELYAEGSWLHQSGALQGNEMCIYSEYYNQNEGFSVRATFNHEVGRATVSHSIGFVDQSYNSDLDVMYKNLFKEKMDYRSTDYAVEVSTLLPKGWKVSAFGRFMYTNQKTVRYDFDSIAYKESFNTTATTKSGKLKQDDEESPYEPFVYNFEENNQNWAGGWPVDWKEWPGFNGDNVNPKEGEQKENEIGETGKLPIDDKSVNPIGDNQNNNQENNQDQNPNEWSYQDWIWNPNTNTETGDNPNTNDPTDENNDVNGSQSWNGEGWNGWNWNNMQNEWGGVWNNWNSWNYGWYNPYYFNPTYNPYYNPYYDYFLYDYQNYYDQGYSEEEYAERLRQFYLKDYDRTHRFSFLVGASVSKYYKQHEFTFRTSFLKNWRYNVGQIGVSYIWYPKGSLNLFLKTRLFYLFRSDHVKIELELVDKKDKSTEKLPLIEESVGVRVTPWLWLEAAFLYGDLKGCEDSDINFVYLPADETRFRTSIQAIVPIENKYNIFLSYRLTNRISSTLSSDVNTFYAESDDVYDHVLSLGVKWNFLGK